MCEIGGAACPKQANAARDEVLAREVRQGSAMAEGGVLRETSGGGTAVWFKNRARNICQKPKNRACSPGQLVYFAVC